MQPTSTPIETVLPGEKYLETLGLESDKIARDLALLDALYIGFMLIALILFLWKMPRTKRGGKQGRRVAAATATAVQEPSAAAPAVTAGAADVPTNKALI